MAIGLIPKKEWDTDYLLDELKKYKIQFTFERIT